MRLTKWLLPVIFASLSYSQTIEVVCGSGTRDYDTPQLCEEAYSVDFTGLGEVQCKMCADSITGTLEVEGGTNHSSTDFLKFKGPDSFDGMFGSANNFIMYASTSSANGILSVTDQHIDFENLVLHVNATSTSVSSLLFNTGAGANILSNVLLYVEGNDANGIANQSGNTITCNNCIIWRDDGNETVRGAFVTVNSSPFDVYNSSAKGFQVAFRNFQSQMDVRNAWGDVTGDCFSGAGTSPAPTWTNSTNNVCDDATTLGSNPTINFDYTGEFNGAATGDFSLASGADLATLGNGFLANDIIGNPFTLEVGAWAATPPAGGGGGGCCFCTVLSRIGVTHPCR